MDMDKSEVLSLALLAAKAAGTGGGGSGTGWTVSQIRMLESILNAVTYTDQDTQDTADDLIASLLGSASGGGSDDPGGNDPENPDNPGGGDDPDNPDNPDNPGGGDDPGDPDDPDNPGSDPQDPDDPGTDVCTAASGEITLSSRTTGPVTWSLTPQSGTAFAQEPNKVSITYVSGSKPQGYRLYSVVLVRSGSTWSVSSIHNGNNASNLTNGGAATVAWGTGYMSVSVSGIKATHTSDGAETTVEFDTSSSNHTCYRLTAEVV